MWKMNVFKNVEKLANWSTLSLYIFMKNIGNIFYIFDKLNVKSKWLKYRIINLLPYSSKIDLFWVNILNLSSQLVSLGSHSDLFAVWLIPNILPFSLKKWKHRSFRCHECVMKYIKFVIKIQVNQSKVWTEIFFRRLIINHWQEKINWFIGNEKKTCFFGIQCLKMLPHELIN